MYKDAKEQMIDANLFPMLKEGEGRDGTIKKVVND